MSLSAIVLAGGLGTRLRSLTHDRFPKPMIPVPCRGSEYPFLEFPLAHLRAEGITDLVLCIGHEGEIIQDYFESGDRFGLNIHYEDDGSALTATRVLQAGRDYSALEHIIVCGDVFQAVGYSALMKAFHRHPGWLMQVVASSDAESGLKNVAWREDGTVTEYSREGVSGDFMGVETGTLCLSHWALDYFNEKKDLALAPDIYRALIADARLGAYDVRVPFYDIGTPEGYSDFCRFVDNGGAIPLSLQDNRPAA